jgi:hypothetical protein
VTPSSGLLRVHPSRIVEFAGNELPDWRLAPLGGGWDDSVLQTVDDALKDWAMTVAGVASMVNDAKVDVISVPGLSERASSQKYRDKLIQRFSVANMSKSINNSLLIPTSQTGPRGLFLAARDARPRWPREGSLTPMVSSRNIPLTITA